MTISIDDRIVFLKKIHLFRGLDDLQLQMIASELEEKELPVGSVVFKQGAEGDYFYLIYSGTARVTRTHIKQDQELALFVPEDYFGEEGLIKHGKRFASVKILSDALLLALSRERLLLLLNSIKKLKPNFEVAVSSRELARQLQFKWLQPEEVIYFLARKHPILLWQAMILPGILLLLPMGLLFAFLFTTGLIYIYLAAASLVVDAAWIVWRVIDWGNDYYIVTNLRAIWLEKVVALYDSRQEAPLSTILSVGVETDQGGRLLDYGDVIIRTFVGRISFHHVSHPYQAATLIEEHWSRAKSTAKRQSVDALKRSIRLKLGLPEPESGRSAASIPAPITTTSKAGKFQDFIDKINIFKVRFEDKGGTITYRKHWIVLFEQIWLPSTVFLCSLGLSVWKFANLPKPQPGIPSPLDPLLAILIVVCVFSVFWWIYQYWDWSNDIFQVTLDQIFDIDRKPLGREERKSAALDNILSTEANRRGFFQVLFNYGDVYISVGGTQMDFFDVFDPSGVQQDIDRRRMARIDRKKQAEADAQREQMADFFAMYYQNSDEFHKELAAKKEEGPTQQQPVEEKKDPGDPIDDGF